MGWWDDGMMNSKARKKEQLYVQPCLMSSCRGTRVRDMVMPEWVSECHVGGFVLTPRYILIYFSPRGAREGGWVGGINTRTGRPLPLARACVAAGHARPRRFRFTCMLT